MNSRTAVVGICLAAAGCGGTGDDEPEPIEGPAKEVAAVIERFEKATREHDFTAVCAHLLATAVRSRAGGADCPRILGERARDVRRPRIRIDSIDVSGTTARAEVHTTAAGQASVANTIRLVREGGRFKIASLGG